MNGLILSLFPGLDLLGRAFESAGWCVVRGPDVLWAQDVRGWHPPRGRFDGVIGGPPCQMFSRLANLVRSQGHETRFGNLIPEYERVVAEAKPSWWLMEQVPAAPVPAVPGYRSESILLSPRDLGDPQSRDRRITVGASIEIGITGRLPALRGSQEPPVPAVTGACTKYENRPGRRGITNLGRTWPWAEEAARRQGYLGLGDALRSSRLWTAEGACQAIANGVPRVMGEALAEAITEWWSEVRDGVAA